jgi:hypothetical protein
MQMLVYKQELKERMFVLQIVNDMEGEKAAFLKNLCRNIAKTMFRNDPDNLLVQKSAESLGLDSSELNVSNFGSRAYRTLHKKVCSVTVFLDRLNQLCIT